MRGFEVRIPRRMTLARVETFQFGTLEGGRWKIQDKAAAESRPNANCPLRNQAGYGFVIVRDAPTNDTKSPCE